MKVYNKQSDRKLNNELLQKLDEFRKIRNFDAKKYINDKANLLNLYMRKSKLSACVVAVSGGIDSAIVLGIVNYAQKQPSSPIKKIIPLLLPISKSIGVTNQDDATNRGKELCECLGLEPHIVDLSEINNLIRKTLEPNLNIVGEAWAIGQLGPYSRTPILYYTTSLLNQSGYGTIICGTTNKDEGAYLGYVGKASDGMVDVQLISDIHKSEVYKVAKYLKLPKSIIDVIPSGDMYDNRCDEVVFGASYDFVELYLNYLKLPSKQKSLFVKSLSDESKQQFKFFASNLENLHNYNKHKYIAKSPAVHLDLYDSSIKGGWDNYYKVTQRYLNDK